MAKVAGVKPKLPKLHLPKFSEDVRAFWDGFDCAIHKNPDLSSIDKFNFLKALLEDLQPLPYSGLHLSEGNYSAAVELIKEQYDKTKQVIATHMDELTTIPPCSGDKAIYICVVYDDQYSCKRARLVRRRNRPLW